MPPLARIVTLMWILARPLIAAGPFDVCDRAWPEATDRTTAARCYYEQAQASGRLDEGVARVEALLTEHPDAGGLHCALGFLAMALGDQVADVHFRRAVEVFGEHRDQDGALLALKSLHYLLVRQGRLEEAAAVIETAREQASRFPSATQGAEVDLLEATQISRFGGDRVRAQALLAQAIPVFVNAGSTGSLLRAAHLRASNSRHLGRRIVAEAHYQQLEAWGLEHAQPWATAAARIGIALLRLDWLKGRPTDAGRAELITLFEQALVAAEQSGDRATALHAHRLLGDLLEGPAADAHHRRCMELAPATDVLSRATCARSIARQIAATDPDEARRLLDQVLSVDAGVEERSRAWFERSVLAWATESEEAAWATSLRGLDSIETLRRGQVQDGGRAGVFSLWLDPYYQVVGALLGRETTSRLDLARAFQISERIRARVLLETLRWVEPGVASIVEGAGTDCPPVGLVDFQAALADDEAVLSYLLNNPRDVLGRPTGGAWLLMVTRDDIWAFPLPERMRIEPAIDITLGLIPRRDGAATAPLARLHQQLLAPALAVLPAEVGRLTLIPDGALHSLPFAALVPERGGPPIGSRIRFAYVPSASFLVCQRQRQRTRRGMVNSDTVVLADPVVSAGRLPHARREAKAVRSALGRRVEVHLGKDAAESALRDVDLGGAGIIHLAAHAVVDNDHPERSAVLLTPESDRDGRLEPHEILDLDLRGTVVVLSACRSAGGAISSGEGVMSLARSFFQAGASAVVGGLWALDDDETADVVTLLYEGLARGETLRDALASAQRARIAAGGAAADWAGLIVLGDTDRRLVGAATEVRSEASWSMAILMLLLVLASVVGGLWWRQYRPHNRRL